MGTSKVNVLLISDTQATKHLGTGISKHWPRTLQGRENVYRVQTMMKQDHAQWYYF